MATARVEVKDRLDLLCAPHLPDCGGRASRRRHPGTRGPDVASFPRPNSPPTIPVLENSTFLRLH